MERRRPLIVGASVLLLILGVLAVVWYAHGADSRARGDYETVSVLVAKTNLASGQSFTDAVASGAIGPKDVIKADVISGAVHSTSAITAGNVTLMPLYAGQQIVASQFGAQGTQVAEPAVPIPAGMIAISVSVSDPGRVAGFLTPGSYGAIYSLSDLKSSPNAPITDHTAAVVVPKALVLANGNQANLNDAPTGAPTTQAGSTPVSVITIAVNQQDALKVLAADNGRGGPAVLTFALLRGDTKIDPSLKFAIKVIK